jgi:metal-responsive CopG/Arc/MetJ family transcriptional regulator
MKTAVSVPDDIFRKADHLARAAGKSRSEVYAAALRDYVARHAPDEITEALNRVVNELGDLAAPDPFVEAAARRSLESSEW